MIFKNFNAIISSSKDFNLNIVIDSDYELSVAVLEWIYNNRDKIHR